MYKMATNPDNPPSKASKIATSYYSRLDIQNAMFAFCKNRETVANHDNKFFAKRPDTFDYPSDILNQAKNGATSFHTSEEIWKNPLDIKTDMTPEQYNSIKTGWDLLIDIDSPFLDYGKIAARLLIEELEKHGVHNIGIKFSGSKGFHIIVPFKAFPKTLNGLQTKNHFPEFPRAIAQYLFKKIRGPMNDEILRLSNKEKLIQQGELISEHLCPKCATPTITKTIGKYVCQDIKCKTEVESMKSNRKEMQCPGCNGKMLRISIRKIQYCESCKKNTAKLEITSSYGGVRQENFQKQFKEEITIKSTEDSVDIVLVSPRHLFRAPYSLHEKTGYASIPIKKENLESFKPSDADPLKITKTYSFMPDSVEGEAEYLLVQSLKEAEKNKPKEIEKKYEGKGVDLKGLTITPDMYPPVIKKILLGIPKDGRKRALSLLLSFFTSLEFPADHIKEIITEWNSKNYAPLKEGYIKSQIDWALKNPRLPPNYDKPIYKEFGISGPPLPGIKNPINYTIKKAFQAKSRPSEKFYVKPKNKGQI
jgi:DNA primase catalytic subunit